MDEYQGTTFRGLKIPCHIFVEGNFKFNDVNCHYDPVEIVLPEDMAAYRDRLVEKRRKEAEDRGAPFYDGQQVRLKNYGTRMKDIDSRDLGLVLFFGPASFFTYSATNHSLDEKILVDDKGNPISIREKYIRDPLNLNDILQNSTGVSATLRTTVDKQLIIVERSMKLAQYPGLYGDAIAGFMQRNKDIADGVPNPFKTLQREAYEEAGIRCSPEDFVLFAVGRAMDDLHGEIWGELKVDMAAKEVLELPKKAKYENLRMFSVPFDPEAVLRYVNIRRKKIQKFQSGFQHMLLILSILL